MSGAAYLNAKAAYKAGAGLVQIYTKITESSCRRLLPEAIVKTYDFLTRGELIRLLKWADTVCIGSGMGTSEKSKKNTEDDAGKSKRPMPDRRGRPESDRRSQEIYGPDSPMII